MNTTVIDREPLVDIDRRGEARRAAAISGVRAIAPLVAGLAPLALSVGATAARTDIPISAAWASSAILYGASGQLTWMEVVGGGGPAALAVAATLIVNLQMLLYGTAMRPYWEGESFRWRIASAQLLVSPVFAVAMAHHPTEPDPELRRRFYTAAAGTLWIAWMGITGIGAALGGLPSVPVLALLAPLVMLSLALRPVVDAATTAALLVAAVLAVMGTTLPFDLGSVGAGIAGMAAGLAVDSRRRGRPVASQETER